MEFYEFAKEVVVFGAFGAFIGWTGWTIGYGISQLLVYICKKVKAHKENKAVKQQDSI